MNRARFIPYALILIMAIYGQYLAAVKWLEITTLADRASVLAVAVSIELMAVWLAWLARQRAALGERFWPYMAISSMFAGLAIGINVLGHLDIPWMVAVFGGFSAAGFVVFVLEMRADLADLWDRGGIIRTRVPADGALARYESNYTVRSRARIICQLHIERQLEQGIPAHRLTLLGPVTALEQARAQLGVEDRRRRIQTAIRTQAKEAGMSGVEIELAMLAYDTQAVAGSMIDGADNGGLSQKLVSLISPERLIPARETPDPADRLILPPHRTSRRRADRPVPTPNFQRRRLDTEAIPTPEQIRQLHATMTSENGTPPTVREFAARADMSPATAGRRMKELGLIRNGADA